MRVIARKNYGLQFFVEIVMKKNLLLLLGLLMAGSLMSPPKKKTYTPLVLDDSVAGLGRGESSPRGSYGSSRGGHVSHRSGRSAHSPGATRRSKSPARHARVSQVSATATAGAGSSAKPAETPKHLKATKHAHKEVVDHEAKLTRALSVGALRGTRSSHLARAGRGVVGRSVHDEATPRHHVSPKRSASPKHDAATSGRHASPKRGASPKRDGATVGSLHHRRSGITRANLRHVAIKGVPAPAFTVGSEEDTSPLG